MKFTIICYLVAVVIGTREHFEVANMYNRGSRICPADPANAGQKF